MAKKRKNTKSTSTPASKEASEAPSSPEEPIAVQSSESPEITENVENHVDNTETGAAPVVEEKIATSEIETPALEEPVADSVTDAAIAELEKRIEGALKATVQEKRLYDSQVNRVNRKLSELTAQKNKMENELSDLTSGVNRVLREIESIKSNPAQANGPPVMEGIRGPPLMSQDELFAKAWESGQVQSSYSGYSQRWKSSNRYRNYKS